jgi:REP element-mobilizing transposase RayT
MVNLAATWEKFSMNVLGTRNVRVLEGHFQPDHIYMLLSIPLLKPPALPEVM